MRELTFQELRTGLDELMMFSAKEIDTIVKKAGNTKFSTIIFVCLHFGIELIHNDLHYVWSMYEVDGEE